MDNEEKEREEARFIMSDVFGKVLRLV